VSLTKHLIAVDFNLFAESFFNVLNNSNNFSKFKPNERKVLMEYIILIHNQEKQLKNIINELINFSRGLNQPDFIIHCELEIVMMKKKLNSN